MTTYADIFKKSFVEGFHNGNVSTSQILVTLLFVCILAAYIFAVYYVSMKKTFYNRSFNIALALISVISASIILAMQSNLVISLGMVGALSIVRFRTAIKDPKDLMFLFWSISVGIICGAGMYEIAIFASVVITIGLLVLEMTPAGRAASILIINASTDGEEQEIQEVVRKYSKVYRVKSRNISAKGQDFIIECKAKDEKNLIQDISKLKGVFVATLMAHDGDITV